MLEWWAKITRIESYFTYGPMDLCTSVNIPDSSVFLFSGLSVFGLSVFGLQYFEDACLFSVERDLRSVSRGV